MGVPSTFELAQPTRPYYRSTYVFVTRRDRGLRIRSLDDPRLRTLRIGVHVIGEDGASVPPAQALADRGIVHNVVGYSIYGDYSRPNPPAALIDAVARGEVDVAIAWGPFAGYFAPREPVALDVAPIDPIGDTLPLRFDISMGVRRDDPGLRDTLDRFIARHPQGIRAVLDRFGVPRVAAVPR
jgi:ABC-type amino acid transport substrate-binding protein